MAWDNAVVTNKGLQLLQQVLEGQDLILEGAAGGSGIVSPASLMAQTALKNQKQIFPIVNFANVENGKKINIQITNNALAESYPMQQVGIWAHVGIGDSTLLAILQDNTGLTIPSETELPDFAMNFYTIINFSNEAEFQLIVDPSTLVTVDSMNTAIAAAVSVKQDIITVIGLLKSDGDGNIIGATPGVDYGYPLKSGEVDPTSETMGTVGQHYVNTTTGQEFACTKVDDDEYTWILLDASDAISAHNIDRDAHGDIRAGIAALDSRTTNLEMIIGGGIATNPFSITFTTLDGVDVTGVWNNVQGRIEF